MTWRRVSAGRTPRRRWESLLRPLSLQLADGGVEDQVAVGPCEMKLAVCFKFTLARHTWPALLLFFWCFFGRGVSGGAENILIFSRADGLIILGDCQKLKTNINRVDNKKKWNCFDPVASSSVALNDKCCQ